MVFGLIRKNPCISTTGCANVKKDIWKANGIFGIVGISKVRRARNYGFFRKTADVAKGE